MHSFRYPSIRCEQYLQVKQSATRSYHLFHRKTITAPQRRLSAAAQAPRFWVPPAYRGGGGAKKVYEQREGGPKKPSFRDTKNRHGKGRPSQYKQKEKPNQEDVATVSVPNLDAEKKRLSETCNNLLLLSRQYRDHLARNFQSTPVNASSPAIQDEKNFKSSTPTTKQLKNALYDIHSTETTLTWNHIMETELMFREISAALQEAIVLPACLAREEKSLEKRNEYADLAEFSLRQLLSFRSERALLIKSVRNWSSKVAQQYHRKPSKSSSIKAWVATLFETAGSDSSETGAYAQIPQGSGSFAHEDPSLGASQNMFRAVMESIALTIPGFKLDIMALDSHDSSSENIVKVSDRMVNLLDILPSPSSVHSELFEFVMQIFGSVGTLESARNSFDYYRRHSHVIPFSLVLKAYCEAAKREEDDKLSRAIADECLNLVQQEWDMDLPGKWIDGVTHLCLALECLFLAKGGTDVDVCDRVESLAEQILTKEKYDNILSEEVHTVEIRAEGSTIHLIDNLVKVLASCQDEKRIRRAQKMLDFLIHYNGWEEATPTFPSNGACNQLLDAMCWLHQGHPKDHSEEEKRADLDYAFSLLHYMQTKGKTSCWPDDSTFLSICRMLSAVSPDDIGERAESLLSKMEMRNPNNESEATCISLAMYHRVLGCWVEAAHKKGTSGKAFQKTMYLLEQMEIQSMPLLMTEREIRRASVKALYRTELQPTVRTYKLILGIFQTEAKNAGDVSQDSEQLLFALFEGMKLRGILSSEPAIRKLFKKCIQSIKRGSEAKRCVQAFLEDLER